MTVPGLDRADADRPLVWWTRSLTLLSAGLGLGLVCYFWTLPPKALPPPNGRWTSTTGTFRARGVVHVHTRRSDGSGTLDDVARAAARAGLDFVVFSDHGDGTVPREAPRYRSGVLCIDAVEVSTAGGHLLALGMSGAPYRLAGQPRDVVDDIHRFGGVAVAAHPDSPKPELAWRDWSLPVDGFEWLNMDTEWRDEGRLTLAGALAHYGMRGPESLASLFATPTATLARWDRLSIEGRHLITLAAADAHARLGGQDEADGDADTSAGWNVPSYESIFRTLSTVVELDARLSGRAERDAAAVLNALATGRSYSTIDAYARGGALEFFGDRADGRRVRMGDRLAPGELTRLTARLRAPATATVRLLGNGVELARTTGLELTVDQDRLASISHAEPVAYRIEVLLDPARRPGAAPWLVSNAIWEGEASPDTPSPLPLSRGDAATDIRIPLGVSLADGAWHIEHDRESAGTLEPSAVAPGKDELQFDFSISHARSAWAAAALVLPQPVREALPRQGRVSIRLRGSRAMRVLAQLRAPSSRSDLRWVRSIYVSPDPSTVVLPLRQFEPVGPAAASARREDADNLLLVVDRLNTLPGSTGTLWIEQVEFGQ